MRVNCYEYHVFFELLCEAIIKKEFISKNKRVPPISKLWQALDEKEYIEKFGGGYKANSVEYFKKRKDALNPRDGGRGPVNDIAMYKALVYIGMDRPASDTEFHKKRPVQKGNVLFKDFQERYHDEIAQVEQDYKDDDPGPSPEPNVQLPYTEEKTIALLAKTFGIFFKALTRLDYKVAYDMLSSEHKEKLKKSTNGFRRFVLSNAGLITIHPFFEIYNLTVKSSELIDCGLFLRYSVKKYTTSEIQQLASMKMVSVGEITEALNKIKQLLKTRGVASINTITLEQLFDVRFPFNLWLTHRLDAKKIEELFDVKVEVEQDQLFQCTCKFEDEMWKIQKLVPLKVDLFGRII